MRILTLFFGLFGLVVLTGCTVAEQGVDDVGDRLQQGLQGQGRIVPNNPTSDSFGSDYN